MFGFDLLTLVIIGATIVTSVVWWFSYLFSDGGSESASVIMIVSGLFFVVEIIYLVVRFVKFVWFL